MIKVNTITKSSDNAGGLLFKTIRISGGHARRYARLGEIVWSVVRSRRSYAFSRRKDKKEQIRVKVKKKRKIKARKKADQRLPLYWTLLVATKKAKRRADGSFIKFDENRVITFEHPEKFGPAGKTEGIPRRRWTRLFWPLCRESYDTPKKVKQFKQVWERYGKALT